MKLIYGCFLWLSIGIGTSAFCQISHTFIDSLKRQLPIVREDTSRVQLYISIGHYYEGSKVDSAIYFYQQAGKLSEKINYPEGTIKYIAYYTEVLNHQGKYDQALALNLQAVAMARKHGLKLQLAKSLVNVAVSYQYKAAYETCLQYYLKAIPIFEELKYEDGLHVLYSNLSVLYGHTLEEYDKALHYGNKALSMARSQNNLYGTASALLNNGILLTRMKNYDQALQIIREGYQISQKIGNLYLQKTALNNTVDIYLHQQQYTRAIPLANETLALSRTMGDTEGEVIALGELASAYLHIKNFLQAKHYASQAVALCQTHQLTDEWSNKILQLAHIELALGNIDTYEALSAKGDSLKRAILNETLRLNLQELETKYESDRKENQIKQLQKEKEIQLLTIRQKDTLNYVFVGATFALLALGFLFYRNARNQKIIFQQTQTLQEQRIKELEQTQQLVAAHAILQGQEAERSRLAKDLHDGLGSLLSGVKLSLSGVQEQMILSAQDTANFSRALEQLDTTIRELRRVAHSMMPEALGRFGLATTLQDFCHELSRSTGLPIVWQSFGMDKRLDPNTEFMIYRVIQELLHNVVKHAEATEVLVQIIQTENHVTLTVEDDGKGFDTGKVYPGIGLSNIRSRVDYLGGSLDIRSAPGEGTTVTIDFALKNKTILAS